MKKHIKKFWLLLIVPVAVGLLVNWLTPFDIPAAVWSVLKWIWSLLVAKFSLPVWLILLLMLMIPAFILILIAVFLNRSGETHLTYVSDNFFGISWHWQYTWGELYDESIVPRCPQCKSVLQPVEESGYRVVDDITLLCHHCGFKQRFEFNLHTLVDRVKREIDRKIVTREYLKA